MKKPKGGTPPSHPVFSAIEELTAQALTLEDILFTRAVYEIRRTITQEKQNRGEMGFDDLLTRWITRCIRKTALCWRRHCADVFRWR